MNENIIVHTWPDRLAESHNDIALTYMTPIMGIAIDKVCNPRIDALFAVINDMNNRIRLLEEQRRRPESPSLRVRLGLILISIGERIAYPMRKLENKND